MQITPPFRPSVEGEDWLEGFDKEFTSEKAVVDDKGEKNQSNTELDKMFTNF